MLYALKDCANLIIKDAATGTVVLDVNYARTSSLEFTSDQVFAYNKNVKAVRFDSNREGTFTTTMQVFPMNIIPLLFGTEFKEDTVPWMTKETLKVTNGQAVMQGTPKVGSLQVFKVEEDDKLTHTAEQKVGNTATANYYTISGQTLSFNTSETFAEDGWIVCYYFVDKVAETFTVDNISFPGGFIITGESNIRGTDQQDKFFQFDLLNVKPQSNASLTMDVEDVCTLEITWDIMANAEGNMMTWKVIKD